MVTKNKKNLAQELQQGGFSELSMASKGIVTSYNYDCNNWVLECLMFFHHFQKRSQYLQKYKGLPEFQAW